MSASSFEVEVAAFVSERNNLGEFEGKAGERERGMMRRWYESARWIILAFSVETGILIKWISVDWSSDGDRRHARD